MSEQQTRELILSCVDRGLAVLGRTGRAATVYMLETRYGFTREKFSDTRLLTNSLRAIFGTGSHILFKAIADQLRSVSPVPVEARAALQDAAREVEEALYGVEHGLGLARRRTVALWRQRI